MTHTLTLSTHSMSDIVLIDVYEFHFVSALFAHHPIHPNQIPRERVQATRHESNTVNKLQLSCNLLHLTWRGLIFIYGDVDIEADVLSFFSAMTPMQWIQNQTSSPILWWTDACRNHLGCERWWRYSGESHTEGYTFDEWHTSVFPSVVAVIPHLFVPWFEAFQTDVALPCSNELSPMFQH